jgi:hypothetical protein
MFEVFSLYCMTGHCLHRHVKFPINSESFREFLDRCGQAPEITDVRIADVSLASFDSAVQSAGRHVMNPSPYIKADLTQSLKALHLPTIRQCYEEVARQAEREQLAMSATCMKSCSSAKTAWKIEPRRC